MSVALIRPPVTCIRPASASAIVGAASWLSATAAVTQRHTRTAVVGGSSATRALSVSLCESTVSLLVDRDRDLVAAPERDGPRRVVQPRGGLADGLESDGAPRLEELFGARGDGVGAAVAGEPQDGHRFGGQGDKADSLVVWRWQAVHGPCRGHEEADDPAFHPGQRLGDRCGHRDLLASAPVHLLGDRCGHRDSAVLVVAPEDIAGQSAEPRTARRLFVGGDSGFGGDTWAVTADFHPVAERPGGVTGLFGSNADARYRQHRLDELTHHNSDLAQHAAILS